LGETIIQKLVAAGITTVETLADMTPEQLEEIPGIGEKTLEKISVAVRHYFGQFEEGEAGHTPESAEVPKNGENSEGGETKAPGELEIETAPAVVAEEEAEAENAQVVLEEAESVEAAEEGTDILSGVEAEVEDVPVPDEAPELTEDESEATDEQAAKEDGA
jgi:N utilization substance protein A